MVLTEDIKTNLRLLNNTSAINDEMYKRLLDVVVQDLLHSETSDLKSICGTKPDVIKEVHAYLLKVLLKFAQNNLSKEQAYTILTKDCKLDQNRSKKLCDVYEKHKIQLEHKLGGIGTHLPHIVDVDWDLECLVKSSAVDGSEGSLFKVTLITEKYDVAEKSKKLQNEVFWCTNQEMQHLVSKFEEAVRECQRIDNGH